jgi:hypothetical protein
MKHTKLSQQDVIDYLKEKGELSTNDEGQNEDLCHSSNNMTYESACNPLNLLYRKHVK